MFIKSTNCIIKKTEGNGVIVVGAGKEGVKLVNYMIDNGVHVIYIFDNSEWLQGKSVLGIPIVKPYRYKDDEVNYVITVSDKYRTEVTNNLISLGIESNKIIKYHSYRDYEYMMNLNPSEYKEEISQIFLETQGFDMDWEHPKTYNEIINWEKLNDDNPLKSRLSDKYLVKKWIEEMIGKGYTVNTICTWDDPEQISFDNLPERFALKMNNGSGRNIIVKDRSLVDLEEIKDTFSKWMKMDFGKGGLELHYSRIKPKIICEEYLDGYDKGGLDYKVYCFNGKPEYIQRIVDEHRETARARFYDCDWIEQEFNHGYQFDETVEKPDYLSRIIELSNVLCKGFKHVRVDWFVLPDKRILFSEMSFSSWAGIVKFVPQKYDLVFGELIRGKK